MLAFYQLPTFFLVMSKRSIFWRFCTLGFFVFFSHEGNLLSAVDIVEFWMFVTVFSFFPAPYLQRSLVSKALELQESA